MTTRREQLRIALVHPFAWPAVRRGGERYLADLEWYLSEAGHHVDVVTSSPGQGVTRFGFTAAAALAGRRYDVVQALMAESALAARLVSRRVVFSTLGHPGDVLGVRGHALFAAAVRAAAVTTAPSQSAATRVLWFAGRPATPLSPGVRLDRFPPRLEPRLGPPIVFFPAGGAEERKGLHHAVLAFARLLDRHADARLVVAGPGSRSWAQDHLASYGTRVARTVDVVGELDPHEMAARYRAATLTVLPSWQEAFGLVLVESLASGTPVVCTAEGGMPEIVTTPKVGRVAGRAGDVDALVVALAETVELAREAGAPGNCAAHARAWGWKEYVGPRHEALYRMVTAPQAPQR